MAIAEMTEEQEVCKYKTAAAEERAMMRRLNRHRVKLEKEMEGMTYQEQADYINRLGDEAAAKMGITTKAVYKVDNKV